MRLLMMLLIMFVCAAGPAVAGPFEDGVAAHDKGDYATALRLWRPLAERGDVRAQAKLGLLYDNGQGVTKDQAAAAVWYRKAAEQGDARGQNSLGVMYANGEGVTKDYATALSWFRKAADQGDARGQTNLGLMYEKGQGVPQDYVAAAAWYRKAAEQGDAGSQAFLGIMYGNGQGVPQDHVAALAWAQKAADQGNAVGQTLLGAMYSDGQIVPQDYVAAAAWYRKAAEQGDAVGQLFLGKMFVEGRGVPTDYVQAYMWINLAAAQLDTDADAVKERDIVAKKMTPAQIAEAQKLAREWKPTQPIVSPTAPTVSAPSPHSSAFRSSIQMKKEGGTYVVPVLVNNAITLDFMVDSGASDVSIPEDVVTTLMRMGTIRDTDFIGEKTYTLADGSKVKSKTFRIRSLKVGDRVLENVTGSVADKKGALLLGQSFLGRFKSWSIDNSRHALVLE